MNSSEIRNLTIALILMLVAAGGAFLFAGESIGWKPVEQTGSQISPSGVKPDKTIDVANIGKFSRELAPSQKTVTQPIIDVARVSKDGTSVLAGRSPAKKQVVIKADGKLVGVVKSDGNGEWLFITSHKFESQSPKLAAALATPEDIEKMKASKAAAAPTAVHARPHPKTSEADAETDRQIAVLRKMIAAAKRDNRKVKVTTVLTTPSTANGTTPKPKQKTASGPARRTDNTVYDPNKFVLNDTPDPRTSRFIIKPTTALVPVPIRFRYREATFTEKGRVAARLLLQYVKLKGFTSVTLTGHADDVGSAEYNMTLSSQRLETVRKFLVSGGYKGRLKLIPMGETSPYKGIDRSRFSLSARRQLDRRVELRLN